MGVGRFAPSTTGPAHPGTLFAALLCWLDARSRGDTLVLRLEDLDPQRCRPEWADAISNSLGELGLHFDRTLAQSASRTSHEAALDGLAESGVLYRCRCSRKDLRELAPRKPGNAARYPGTCRAHRVTKHEWRESEEPLRVELPRGRIEVHDEGEQSLSQDPDAAMGDPVVRRRDGAIAYHLAGVVDDANVGVTRIVRGNDLADSTATQVALQRLLGYPLPTYRHHMILLEEHGTKLSKLHGSVDHATLRDRYTSQELCGILAHAAGLQESSAQTTPRALLHNFSWDLVPSHNRLLHWNGRDLVLAQA